MTFTHHPKRGEPVHELLRRYAISATVLHESARHVAETLDGMDTEPSSDMETLIERAHFLADRLDSLETALRHESERRIPKRKRGSA